MRRKLLVVALIVAVGMVATGCIGVTQSEFNRNVSGSWHAFNQGIRRINYFIDRHLFNYTWDDPYAFTDVYATR
jgi:hypothetical protein